MDFRPLNDLEQRQRVNALRGNGESDRAILMNRRDTGFAGVAAHFIAGVLDGIACQAPLRHGLTVQRILEGLLTSAESGREVRLPAINVQVDVDGTIHSYALSRIAQLETSTPILNRAPGLSGR